MPAKVDWKKLKHAQGPATRVPQQVKELCGKDSDDAEEAYDVLRSTVVGDGKWFDASAPTLALLLDGLPKARFPTQVLALVGEILGADHRRGWLADAKDGPPAKVLEPVLERRKVLLGALASKDASVRAAATLPLAMAPPLFPEALPLLRERAAKDKDTVVRASALLALGRVGAGDAESERVIEAAARDAEAAVRGAATVARLRSHPKEKLTGASEGLGAWLAWEAPAFGTGETELPWFGALWTAWNAMHVPSRGPGESLVVLARARGLADEALVGAVVDLAQPVDSPVLHRRVGELALSLGKFRETFAEQEEELSFVALREELTPPQLAIARSLAALPVLPSAGFGLPGCGAPRRRWLGLEPAAGSDRVVEVAIEKRKRKLPFWRAWRDLVVAGVRGPAMPPPLEPCLEGADRWHALVDNNAAAYGGQRGMETEALESEVATATKSAEVQRRLPGIGDDLALRFTAAEEQGQLLRSSVELAALVLLPVLRAGKETPESWDVLVPLENLDHAREILAALPLPRRQAIFLRTLRRYPVDHSRSLGTLKTAIRLAELAPTREVLEEITRRIAGKRAREYMAHELSSIVKGLRELAKADKKTADLAAKMK